MKPRVYFRIPKTNMISTDLLLMLSLVLTALLLFVSVYFMITLSDLESDYLNRSTSTPDRNVFFLLNFDVSASHAAAN